MVNKKKNLKDLNDELFSKVEGDLGYAHISDGAFYIGSRKKFFNGIRKSLFHCESAAKKIRRFLKKYGELI